MNAKGRVVCPLHSKRGDKKIEAVFWREATLAVRKLHVRAENARRQLKGGTSRGGRTFTL